MHAYGVRPAKAATGYWVDGAVCVSVPGGLG